MQNHSFLIHESHHMLRLLNIAHNTANLNFIPRRRKNIGLRQRERMAASRDDTSSILISAALDLVDVDVRGGTVEVELVAGRSVE